VVVTGVFQTTNEVVLAVEFHPTDPNTIVTCGKSHIFFWAWSGNSLARKQGIFGVRTFFLNTYIQCSLHVNHSTVFICSQGTMLGLFLYIDDQYLIFMK